MQNLDELATKYFQPPTIEIENDLIMKWYPGRISARTGHVPRCLELGLGHGYTIHRFEDICDEHVVIEGAPSVISHFRANNPGYRGTIVEGFFETCMPEGKFDLIVMGFVLEHVDDPVMILSRYRSFLAPGGRLFVAVPNAKSLNRRLGVEMGMIPDIYALNETDLTLGHQRNYCLQTLSADARQAGYDVTLSEGIYLKPLPLSVLKMLPDMEANLQAMLKVGVDFPELCVALLVELTPISDG